MKDNDRREWLRAGLKEEALDAIIVSLPENVLLATGYFPVVGTSVAIVTREGQVALLAPEDERDLAGESGADRLITFQPGSLDKIETAAGAIRDPLQNLLRQMGLEQAAIGWERDETVNPASYASIHLYGGSLCDLLPKAQIRSASGLLSRMKAMLTPLEIERVRRSCRLASLGFRKGSAQIAAGINEPAAAAPFREPLFTEGIGFEGAHRADGWVFCMAGAHSSRAFGAYARSRPTKMIQGDLVLTHCNSHADGYWTDITRTYSLGAPDQQQRQMYRAVFEARQAALDAIRPGVKACDVDRAARDVMRSHGFAREFKHSTGHGVGFAAINHNALPRLHPKSPEILESGMVFNVEPAVYIEGTCGLRHCDMVAVGLSGAELLTPFQCSIEDLVR